jgi:hypothetical protein
MTISSPKPPSERTTQLSAQFGGLDVKPRMSHCVLCMTTPQIPRSFARALGLHLFVC